MRNTVVAFLAITILIRAASVQAEERNVASAGDAYIVYDDSARTWSVANDGIRATFQIQDDRELQVLQLTNPISGHAWQTSPSPDTQTTIAGRTTTLGSVDGGYHLTGVSASSTDRSVHLAASFDQRDTHLRVTRHYLVYAGVPAIETWTRFEITQTSSIDVSDLNVWHLTVAGHDAEWINGLLGDAMDVVQNDAFSLQHRTLVLGDQIAIGSGGRSSERELPYFKIEADNEAIVGGLLWSGAWRLTLAGRSAGTELTFGLASMTTTVSGSRAVETPHGFLALSGNAADSSDVIRRYVIDALRAGRGFEALVTYNTWFAYGTRIDQGVIEDEMKHVAELGAELFVLDAGWYAGAGRDGPFDFTTGLGNWHADESRFPSDLQGLADIAHSFGLKFGLWVEPERIDLGNVNSGDFADDSWLAMDDGRYDPGAPEGGPRAGQLCLASAGARAWLVGQLVSLIDRVRPDYLKWDNNLWINCNREGHGHGTSDGNFAHVSGLYEVLAALRQRYPQLIIENVSGGGNRLDYGMLQFTDVAWMDDRTAPSLHVRHNLEGLGAALPPSYLFSFVIDHESESLSTGSDLPLYVRSRMAGVLGLTFRTADLRASAARDITAHIGIYKTLRGTIQGASLVLLTRQASADDPPSWDAVQESDAAGRMLIFAFQDDPGVVRITLRPHGLKPDATYDVSSIDLGPIGSASGADLMAGGIEIVQSAASEAHVLVLSQRP